MQAASGNPYHSQWEAWRALLTGDMAGAAALVSRWTSANPGAAADAAHPLRAIAAMRAGKVAEGATILAVLRSDERNRTAPEAVQAARAELLLRQGKPADAAEALAPLLARLAAAGIAEHLLAAQALAEAYVAMGDTRKAILVLEQETSHPRICGNYLHAAFWPQARYDLQRLYQASGRVDEAGKVRKQLLELLSQADDGFPLRSKLQQNFFKELPQTPDCS